MTSIFSILLLMLCTRVLQHAQQSTENGKKQCECANNKARNKAVLFFGFTDFCLMYHTVQLYYCMVGTIMGDGRGPQRNQR